MQKHYLLLRDNRKSGPFTFGELLQQQLKPSDMIWIEGQSAAWMNVSELELHMPVAERTDIAAPPPADEIEQKAEMLRQRALSHAGRPVDPEVLRQLQQQEAAKVQAAPLEFVDHRKKKPSVLGEVVMTLFILGLFAGGIIGSKTLFADKKDIVQRPEVTRMEVQDQHAAAQAPATSAAAPLTIADSTLLQPPVDSTDVAVEMPVKKIQKKIKPAAVVPEPVVIKEDSSKPEVVETPPVAVDEKPAADTKPDSAAQEESTPEKKKGFLKGLFKKKKKDSE